MENVTRLPVDPERNNERRKLHLREISEDGAEPQSSVGQELRAARQRLGEDIRSVAAALRIRREHLEALEQGELDRLPGRTYAIGFVRSYADYLGLDSAAIVQRFKQEQGPLEAPPATVAFPDAPEDVRQTHLPMLIGAVALIAALIGAWYLAQSADRLMGQRLDEAAPESPVSAGAAPAAPPEIRPTAPVPAEPAAAAPAEPAATGPAPPATGRVLGSTDPAARVEIVALRDGAWLRIEDETTGEVVITTTLKAGDRFRAAPDRPNIVLVTRDGGALELYLDGRALGPAGSRGSVLEGSPLAPDALSRRPGASP